MLTCTEKKINYMHTATSLSKIYNNKKYITTYSVSHYWYRFGGLLTLVGYLLAGVVLDVVEVPGPWSVSGALLAAEFDVLSLTSEGELFGASSSTSAE